MTRKLCIAFLLCVGLATTALAQGTDYKLGSLEILQPWARASLTVNGAAYLELANHGSTLDRLVAVTTPVAARAELHEHQMDGGVMKMRPVDGIDIAPGGTAVLKPGGYHVMLMGLKQPLKAGTHFPLTLTFAKAGKLEIDVTVEAAGAMHGDTMKDHDMPGHDMSGHDMPKK